MVTMKLIVQLNQLLNKKSKQNPCMNSSIKVRTKMRKEHTYLFCKQKGRKEKNCDGSIYKVDPNYLIQFIESSCPFKILDEN